MERLVHSFDVVAITTTAERWRMLKKSPLFIVHVSALACRRAKPVLMDVNGAYRWKPGGQCLRVVNLFLVTAAIGHSGALRRCNLFAHCCVSRSRLNMVDKMTQVSFSFNKSYAENCVVIFASSISNVDVYCRPSSVNNRVLVCLLWLLMSLFLEQRSCIKVVCSNMLLGVFF